MKKDSAWGVKRIVRAAICSWEGLHAALYSEVAFRQELIVCAVLLPVPWLLHITSTERALLIGSLFLVLITELANSAIEAVVDRISPEIHPLSKRAKDCGSAVVFLALLNAGCVWGIIVFHA